MGKLEQSTDEQKKKHLSENPSFRNNHITLQMFMPLIFHMHI